MSCKQSISLDFYSKNRSTKDGYQKVCKKCHAIYLKKYRTPEVIKSGNLKQRYKMTLEDYNSMLELQNGGCAACGHKPEKYLQVDHDHSCCPGEYTCGNCVRALLCLPCNVALGAINDDADRLRLLIKYLEASDG